MDPLYHSRVRHDVIPFVPPAARLLDFGGGDGATAAELRRLGIAAHAGVADLVPPAGSHALDFAVQGDLADPATVARIGEAHGPFDTVLALDVLEHFTDPWAVLKSLAGLIAPGGALVASIPNVRHYSVSLPLLFRGEWTYAEAEVLDRTHLRFFTRASAESLMRSAGLTIERVGAIPRQRRRDMALHRLLSPLTGGGLLTLQWVFVARRPG